MLLFHLTIANLKMILRNRQTLFWALAFPVLLMVTMGLMMRGGDSTTVLGVVDQAKDEMSIRLVADLKSVESLQIIEPPDEAAARRQIEDGDLEFVLILPPGLAGDAASRPPARVVLVYDNTTPNPWTVMGVVSQFLDEANLDLAGAESRLVLETEGAISRDISFVDFMVPGMAVWGVASFSVFGIASSMASYREKQILKRMQATPLKVRTFVVSKVLAHLVMAAVQGALILLSGSYIFGVEIAGNIISVLALVMVGNIVFLNMGFIVGSISKSAEAASGLGNALVLPLMFFSGVFFPTDNLPGIIRAVVVYLPLAPLVDSVRGVTIEARALWDYPSELMIVAAWIVATSLLAMRLFRFR